MRLDFSTTRRSKSTAFRSWAATSRLYNARSTFCGRIKTNDRSHTRPISPSNACFMFSCSSFGLFCSRHSPISSSVDIFFSKLTVHLYFYFLKSSDLASLFLIINSTTVYSRSGVRAKKRRLTIRCHRRDFTCNSAVTASIINSRMVRSPVTRAR